MTTSGSGWGTRCPGSSLPHAGQAEALAWMPRSIRRYRDNGHPLDRLLTAADTYVVCSVCGKPTVMRKDGTPRSHPPSRIGPAKEAARRQRALKAIQAELADVRNVTERVADDLAALLSELGEG